MINPDLNKMPYFNKKLYPNAAHIVFSGNKFFSILHKNIKLLLKRNPSIQLWESWSQKSSKIKHNVSTQTKRTYFTSY